MAQTQTKTKTTERTVVREVEMAREYSDGTALVRCVRASYPHVLHPFKSTDDDADKKGKYGIVGLMPKTKLYFPAKDLLRDMIRDLERENKIKTPPGLAAANKFLRDGDLSGRDEYTGMFTINASETRKPIARHKFRDPKTKKPRVLLPDVDEDVIYAGCWVNILIRPWYQNNKFGKKVNAGLVAVQFVEDDEPFGQGRVSEDAVDEDFGEYTDDDSGFDDNIGDDQEL